MTSNQRQWIVVGLCAVALMASAFVAIERSRLPLDTSRDPVFGVQAGEDPEAADPEDDDADRSAEVAEPRSTQGPVIIPLGPTASTSSVPADAVRSPAPAPRQTSPPTAAPTSATSETTEATTVTVSVTEPTVTISLPTSDTTDSSLTVPPTPTISVPSSITRPTFSLPIETTIEEKNDDD